MADGEELTIESEGDAVSNAVLRSHHVQPARLLAASRVDKREPPLWLDPDASSGVGGEERHVRGLHRGILLVRLQIPEEYAVLPVVKDELFAVGCELTDRVPALLLALDSRDLLAALHVPNARD